jgi:NAD(P)-dependent dehydrogenase (short-subunit alcohol dehydrogenase family)
MKTYLVVQQNEAHSSASKAGSQTIVFSTKALKMDNPVILITGALAGIGRATALAAAREGYKVVVSGRNTQTGAALEADLRAAGAQAHYIKADIRNEAEVQALVEGAIARFGRIDIAVNNAGTEGMPGPIVDQTAESYAATFDTNVLGTVLSVKHEVRVMLAQGSGSIVNVSSSYGHRGAPNASIYAASKHAVEGITKSVALELAGSGVRVNAVSPGPIETAMLDRFTGGEERKASLIAGVPLGRTGRPDEIARAILFIGSEAASFITGQILAADGGKTAG